ncbi:MAG: UTRA domain-containing protein [Parvularculaceae bacterium]|nr:UTRA domain-containing protein [Parvularculaceae bacterium]
MNERTHQGLKESIRIRIISGEWPPDTVMPGEADLAQEYGCSRTTVNRALQSLADDGLIERKRRAGTRVKDVPTRQAKIQIPLVRHEVEATGAQYGHHVLLREIAKPPQPVATRLRLSSGDDAFHLHTVHLADNQPLAFEDRWVNVAAAPGILTAPLDAISANEWLLRQVPYSSGDVAFCAKIAGETEANALGVPVGSALFTIDRVTWRDGEFITAMRLYYRPGYELKTKL